jgi:hypothetical protein
MTSLKIIIKGILSWKLFIPVRDYLVSRYSAWQIEGSGRGRNFMELFLAEPVQAIITDATGITSAVPVQWYLQWSRRPRWLKLNIATDSRETVVMKRLFANYVSALAYFIYSNYDSSELARSLEAAILAGERIKVVRILKKIDDPVLKNTLQNLQEASGLSVQEFNWFIFQKYPEVITTKVEAEIINSTSTLTAQAPEDLKDSEAAVQPAHNNLSDALVEVNRLFGLMSEGEAVIGEGVPLANSVSGDDVFMVMAPDDSTAITAQAYLSVDSGQGPSISSTGFGDEQQANRNILDGILKIAVQQGRITQAERQRRLAAYDADSKTSLDDDLNLTVDNQNVYLIDGQMVVVIDAPYLSVTEAGEQSVSAGLRRGVIYITRQRFSELSQALLEETIRHEQDEVAYLRQKAREMFPGLDEATAYELFSSFLKNPNNQKQARELIDEAHQYAQSQGYHALSGSVDFLEQMRKKAATQVGTRAVEIERMAISIIVELKKRTLTTLQQRNVLSDDQQGILNLTNLIDFLIYKKQLNLVQGDEAQQVGVVINWLLFRESSIAKIQPTFKKAFEGIDEMFVRYAGIIVSDPTEFNPLYERILLVDDEMMRFFIPDNPNAQAFYSVDYDLYIIKESTLFESEVAQWVIDHEVNHQLSQSSVIRQQLEAAVNQSALPEGINWRRFIQEGHNELLTYYTQQARSLKHHRAILDPEDALTIYNSNTAQIAAFNVFENDIKQALLAKGYNEAQTITIMLALGSTGLQPLVDALGGWDIFFNYFKPRGNNALSLKSMAKKNKANKAVRRDTSIPEVPNANRPGGIDFRSLPIVIQSVDNLKRSIRSLSVNNLQRIDLSQELSDIQRLVNSGIAPSTERLKEYFAASCLKNNLGNDSEKIISYIANILRSQEESCVLADPVFKDILVVLGSGRNPEELKLAFVN